MGKLVKKLVRKSPIGMIARMAVGKSKSAEATPNVMPLPDDDAVMRAKKRAAMASQSRTGRASTFLSGDSDTLGP